MDAPLTIVFETRLPQAVAALRLTPRVDRATTCRRKGPPQDAYIVVVTTPYAHDGALVLGRVFAAVGLDASQVLVLRHT